MTPRPFFHAFFLLLTTTLALHANEKVALQLKWLHQFQFAGYYAAKEKGYYAEAGLDVEIRERDLFRNNIKQVIEGEAQYGISDSVLLLYRAKGEPVVVVSPVFQHSPNVVITLKSSGIASAYDLQKRHLTFYKQDSDGYGILAMLQNLGVTPDIMRLKDKTNYRYLVENKTDAYACYLSNEPYYFQKAGIPINIINPANYGYDFYGDMLFTSEAEALQHPDRVRRFKEATLKGWRYALEHKDEIVSLIHAKYAPEKSLEHLRYEADALDELIQFRSIPLGTIDAGRIRFILDSFAKAGLLEKKVEVDGCIFDAYAAEISLTPKEHAWLDARREIRFAVPRGFEPAMIENPDGSASGIVPDFMREIGRLIGHPLSLEPFDPKNESGTEAARHAGNFGNAMLLGEANATDYAPSQPYMQFPLIVFSTKTRQPHIACQADLKGLRVAYVRNDPAPREYLDSLEGVIPVPAASPREQLEMLQYDQADAVVGYPNYHYLITGMMLDAVVPVFSTRDTVGLRIGVNPEHAVLAGILDKALQHISEEKRHDITDRWLQHKSPTLSRSLLSPDEQAYLQNKRTIRMCIDPDWMPFEMNDNGRHIGMTADYAALLQDLLQTPIEMVPAATWPESLELGRQRRCDIFSLVMPTEERRKFLDFTAPYLKIPLVIVTGLDELFINDISQVADRELGIVRGYAYVEILKQSHPGLHLVEVENLKEGLEKVKDGELFGMIGTLATTGYNIQKHYIGQLKIAGKFDTYWELGIGTRNDEPMLQTIFQKALNQLTPEMHQAILNKWVSVNYDRGVNYAVILRWIGGTAAVFGLILLIILRANRLLNREIRRRTRIEQDLKRSIDLVDSHIIISSTDLEGRIVEVSNAFCAISGYTAEELLGRTHAMLRDPSSPPELRRALRSRLEAGQSWSGELKSRAKNGGVYWVQAYISPIFDENGLPVRYTAIMQDITNKKRLQELSVTDELTEIFNRRYFNEKLPRLLNSAKRDNGFITLAIMDVDFFKRYNDTYGHIAGDQALKRIAGVMRGMLQRADDYCFRLGGEEFAILLKGLPPEKALPFIDAIRTTIEALAILHEHNDAAPVLTASFGVVVHNAVAVEDIDSLYKEADDLLYRAKNQGRNRIATNISGIV